MPHLLLQVTGGYASNRTALQSESWTCTTRLVLNTGNIDDIATLPTWVASSADEINIQTGFTTESNWNVKSGIDTFSPTDFLDNEATAAWTALLGATGFFPSAVLLYRMNLYPVGTNGKVMEIDGLPGAKAVAEKNFDQGSELKGTSSGAMTPPDVSYALSWQTKRSDGRGRGRMYSPPPVLAVMGTDANDGVLDPAKQQVLLDAGVAYIQAMDGTSGAWGYKPAVIGSPWTNYSAIKAVRVGRNPDTQRRRTRQVSESYLSSQV